jgi:hypothetical protein
MPANARSLRITDTYRDRLRILRARAVVIARAEWAKLDPQDLDGSHARWVATVAATLTELQRGGTRLSAAYLSAYLTSELGRRVSPSQDATAAAGVARDGRPLVEALTPSLFTVKQAIGDGRPVAEALAVGGARAFRTVGEEAIAPGREGLANGIEADGRIVGWRRVTGGGCGACLAAATGAIQADDEVLEVHPACQCSKEPVVAGVPDHVERPTGHQIFEGMSSTEQDQLLGPDKATLIRSGAVPFHDLIEKQEQAVLPTVITERPLESLEHRS